MPNAASVRYLGCQKIAHAASVTVAERALEAATPDVVILDVNLDGESGLPIAEIMRARKIPFIVSSGYGADTFGVAWKDEAHLAKPFTADQLAASLSRVLSAAR